MIKRSKPKILTHAILTTLTILTWVAFEVWRSFTKPQPVQIDTQLLKPLDPSLDATTIGRLKGELYLPDSDARRGASSPTAVAAQIPEASPASTSSAIPKASTTPSPSPGGASQ